MEADRADPEVAAELAGHELEEDLGLAVDAATADTAANTRRGYAADLADFQAYCAEHRVPALPAAPAVIAAYLAVRAHRPPVLAPASLARRLAAIRKVHELNGYRGLANPGRHPDGQRAWAGIRRQHTWTQQQAPEASADQVRAMVAACPLDRFIGVRDRALLLLHYVLGTRHSELAALDVEHLVLVDQGLVAVVWRRKPDQERRDLDLVAVPYLPQPATCAVRAWLAWQEAAGLTSGPAFRPLHPRARLDSPEAPTIRAHLQAAPRLRDEKVSLVLKRLASRAGLADPDRYSSHSTRRGFAAELARRGASDLEIAAAGSAPRAGAPLRHVGRHLGRSPGRPARAVGMVTVTDVDERREVPADRVWSCRAGSGPAGASSASPPWIWTPIGQEGSRRPVGGGQMGTNAEQVGVAGPRPPASSTRSACPHRGHRTGRHGLLRAGAGPSCSCYLHGTYVR